VLGLDREAVRIGARYLWGSRHGAHVKILRIQEWGSGICSDRVRLSHELEVGDTANTRARGVGDSKREAGLSAPREREERPRDLLGRPANTSRESEGAGPEGKQGRARGKIGQRAKRMRERENSFSFSFPNFQSKFSNRF
jgi:hypothetical protein